MHKERIKASLKKYSTLLVQLSNRVACLLLVTARRSGQYVKMLACRVVQFLRTHWPAWKDRIQQYARLTRLDKPIGSLLLLWPMLWALWIAAAGTPDPAILIIFILGVISMRSAGCVINDIADRRLDPHVERTRNRPIPSGRVTTREALLVFLVLIGAAFLLVVQLDLMTIKLAFIGAALAIIYPFTKRYTYVPQLFLGAAFGWAIPMAFSAQAGELPLVAWLLYLTTVLWAVVYDTMYAMVDREDDIKMGMKSTAILFEDADRMIIGIVQLLVLFGLMLVGSRQNFGDIYYAGLLLASLFFIYQQYLIKDRIRQRCFAAFLNNNWFGACVFVGIVLNYYFS